MVKKEDFTRIDADANGNPRYYIPFYVFPDSMTEKQRTSAGLERYRGKKYGRGYVIQSYSIQHDVENINKIIF